MQTVSIRSCLAYIVIQSITITEMFSKSKIIATLSQAKWYTKQWIIIHWNHAWKRIYTNAQHCWKLNSHNTTKTITSIIWIHYRINYLNASKCQEKYSKWNISTCVTKTSPNKAHKYEYNMLNILCKTKRILYILHIWNCNKSLEDNK